MNIREAALKAQKLGRGIARKSDGPRPKVFICTNLTKGIFVIPKSDPNRAYAGWMPTLDDLIATDWYVMGDEIKGLSNEIRYD